MKNKKIHISLIVFTLCLFLSLLIFLSTMWCMRTFGKVSIDSMLFTLLAPTSGTDMSVIQSWIIECLLCGVIITAIVVVAYVFLRKYLLNKDKAIQLLTYIHRFIWIFGVFTLVLSLVNVECQFQVIDYFQKRNQKTEIYETKKQKKTKKKEESDGDETIIYADPHNVEITGEDTNNLIYIYLESYENSFMDKENGGIKDINCMPELTALAKENISFSNTDKMGGALAFTGTTWTIGSMVGQSAGLPLKSEVARTMGEYANFMPGALMIGDILAQKGYVQTLMIGSEAEFAGTDKMFIQHGNYNLIDYNSLKSEGRTQKGDYCYWGINDRALFRNAKDKVTEVANSGQKFNFTIATIDCHTTSGIRCSSCPKTYSNRYENIYACQSILVNDFINWCKQQPWYEKTTIILVGDHNTMAVDYISDIPAEYERTTYNCFINSKVTTKNIKNRQFTQMDMYPTTLAAIGFKIKGNKMGLGTNLFSKLPTTIEKYGKDYIEQEVQKSSQYLDENIYQFN